jgi:hypothetical protein
MYLGFCWVACIIAPPQGSSLAWVNKVTKQLALLAVPSQCTPGYCSHTPLPGYGWHRGLLDGLKAIHAKRCEFPNPDTKLCPTQSHCNLMADMLLSSRPCQSWLCATQRCVKGVVDGFWFKYVPTNAVIAWFVLRRGMDGSAAVR